MRFTLGEIIFTICLSFVVGVSAVWVWWRYFGPDDYHH